MKIWYNNIIDTERHVVEVQGDRIRIGRAASNEIVLDSPYVADEAAVLYRRGNAWELVALGMNGVTLGDRQLFGGERCDIRGTPDRSRSSPIRSRSTCPAPPRPPANTSGCCSTKKCRR